MLYFKDAIIEQLVVHEVGNKIQEGDIFLSKGLLQLKDELLYEMLKKYFLKPFKTEEFFQFQISLTDLADGSLYINGVSYGESAGDKITVLASDVDEITYYTSSSTTNTHALTVNVIDKDQYNRLTLSSPSTITVDRTLQTSAGNQPATIGDSAIYVANQIPTILTLAMFTTGLQPPYNDPEGDLIDAIRIDEVSTANTGQFLFSGVPVIEGTIITREELEAGLFVHVGATANDIKTDSFNFSARDEGSGIWVQ